MSIRLASPQPSVNGGSVADMAYDILSRLNQCRAEQAGPVRLGPAPATPSLAPVIQSPAFRDQRQEMELVTVACANTLRAELEEMTGDRLDVAVALEISAAVLNTYYEAKLSLIQQRNGGQR